MKRCVSLILCMVMVFCCSVPVLAAQNDDIRVVMVDYYNAKNEHVSKKEIKFDVKPVIVDGRTMVPIRFIAEELGYEVDYKPNYQFTAGSGKIPTVILNKDYSTHKNLRSSYPMYDLLVTNLCKWAEKSSSKSHYIELYRMEGAFSKYAFCTNRRDNIPANVLGDYLNIAKKANITVEIPISKKYREMPVTFRVSTDDSKSAMVGCLWAPTDVPAQIIDGRTLIPLRALSESLGLTVKWDGDSRTVFIYGR